MEFALCLPVTASPPRPCLVVAQWLPFDMTFPRIVASALAGVVLTMLELRNPDSLAVATQVWAEFPTKAVFQTTVPRDRTFLQASTESSGP